MDLNIRGVDEVLVKRVKGAALEGGETLREWVIGALESRLGRGMVAEVVGSKLDKENHDEGRNLSQSTRGVPSGGVEHHSRGQGRGADVGAVLGVSVGNDVLRDERPSATATVVREKPSEVKPAPRDQYGDIEWWKVRLPIAKVNPDSQEDELEQAESWGRKNPPVMVEDEQEPLTNWAKRVNHGGRVTDDLLNKLRPIYMELGGERAGE